MLVSTNDRMLAAISRRIDLDGRLDEITGKPPRARYVSAVSAASVAMASAHELLAKYKEQDQRAEDSSNEADLQGQILHLIAEIDLLTKPVDGHFLLGTPARQNLLHASDLFRRLEQGLNERELGADEAWQLMSSISFEIREAADSIKSRTTPERFCAQTSCRRGFVVWRNIFAVICGLAAANIVTAVVISVISFRVFSWSLLASSVAISGGGLACVPLGALARTLWMRGLALEARARMHGWIPCQTNGGGSVVVWAKDGPINAARIRALFGEFLLVQKRVMRLFDEADDRSPQCAPHS